MIVVGAEGVDVGAIVLDDCVEIAVTVAPPLTYA
jgi:hypothetical protein